MKKVVAFGEIMMRLAPEGYLRFVQADRLGVTFGGSEANVAVMLAGLGMDAHYITKLPKHEIGQAAVNKLRQYGVGTADIARGGERIGIYFLEKGASQRPSKVIYDRAGSAIATASRGDFDWRRILEGAGWFHCCGITPALGGEAAAICQDAVETARALGVKVSFDLNYRENLWSMAQAREALSALLPQVDVCVINKEHASQIFGFSTDADGDTDEYAGHRAVAKQFAARFQMQAVAVTLREPHSASDNAWAGMLYTGGAFYTSPAYQIHIVDRVGAGDSLGAGLIYAMANGYTPQDTINFAAAASCLKHTIEGDMNFVSLNEVHSLMGGNASGLIQR